MNEQQLIDKLRLARTVASALAQVSWGVKTQAGFKQRSLALEAMRELFLPAEEVAIVAAAQRLLSRLETVDMDRTVSNAKGALDIFGWSVIEEAAAECQSLEDFLPSKHQELLTQGLRARAVGNEASCDGDSLADGGEVPREDRQR